MPCPRRTLPHLRSSRADLVSKTVDRDFSSDVPGKPLSKLFCSRQSRTGGHVKNVLSPCQNLKGRSSHGVGGEGVIETAFYFWPKRKMGRKRGEFNPYAKHVFFGRGRGCSISTAPPPPPPSPPKNNPTTHTHLETTPTQQN